MASHVYRFQALGITSEQLWNQLGVTPDAVGVFYPKAYQDITIDETHYDNLVEIMSGLGYGFVETDPAASASKTILRSAAAALPADGSLIGVASGWQDIGLSITLTTTGGSTAGLQFTGIANSSANDGQVRIVASGGSFGGGTVIGPDACSMAALSRACVAGNIPVTLPSTVSTTYTFKMQMQATALLSSITPRKGSALSAFEYV